MLSIKHTLKRCKMTKKIFIVLIFVIFLLANAEKNSEDLLTNLIATSNYKKDDPPPMFNNSFEINVTMYIHEIKVLPEEQKVSANKKNK